MAQEQTVIRQKILQYYRSIKDIFPVKKVLLYGSYAKGQATKDSDIDIAVVVDMENQNQRCDITAQLMYHTVPIDPSIEPRCIFWEEYLHPEPASILDEIIRTGIEIV
jgi:predicted nucleotidyltransferase